MSFMNLKKLKQTAEDVNIVPHPLRGSVDQPVLKAYLKGIVLACFVDDGKLSDVELKSGRAKALALGLEESDFDDAVKVICQLSSDEEKESCLADVLSYIRDAGRTVSFYFVTDLASGMASDGELTQDAVDFLDAVYGLLKLAPADIKFVSNYRPFLIPGRTADASSVVLEAVMNGFDFPEGYVKYFTPDLKPVKIAGGECKESKLMICSGRYLLEEHLTVSKNTELIIKDAEITFGPNAYMSLGGTKIVIENCKFLAAEASVGEADNICSREFIWAYDVGELEIVDCEFDGRSVRSLIGTPTETIQNPETISLLESDEFATRTRHFFEKAAGTDAFFLV